VSIAKLTADETAAADISGGYIIKIDKTLALLQAVGIRRLQTRPTGVRIISTIIQSLKRLMAYKKLYPDYVYQFEKALYTSSLKEQVLIPNL
jgi:hypothetical protein